MVLDSKFIFNVSTFLLHHEFTVGLDLHTCITNENLTWAMCLTLHFTEGNIKNLPTSFIENLGQFPRGHGCHFTRFGDNGVSGDQCWRQFEGQKIKRQVPWADQTSNANGHFNGVVKCICSLQLTWSVTFFIASLLESMFCCLRRPSVPFTFTFKNKVVRESSRSTTCNYFLQG